ncbi:MAG TPA: type II toxin-antitoxin system prevent-host-death family antitoxin [Trueperaceae bacterium]|nr:type II toxin-antitoxin system prevent-host-death family antitoxin [Trueperaceae bacterium]
MPIETTYSSARANLATLLDAAVDDRDIVIIRRRGREDVALIAADELDGLLETAHLLRSPANAQRLLTALGRARSGNDEPQTVKELRARVNLDSARSG